MRIRKNTNISLQILAAAEYSDPSLAQRMCPVNQSPWEAISPVQVNQPKFLTKNGNASLSDSIGAQVNQPGIFTGCGNASLAYSIGAQVNQPCIFTGNGVTNLADSIGAQVNQPGIFTGNGVTSLADSIGVQQRGASKENPILLDDEENKDGNGDVNKNENGDVNGNGDVNKNVEVDVNGNGNRNRNGNGNGNGDVNKNVNKNENGNGNEDKSEFVEVPLLVVLGNKKKPAVYCGTKSSGPIKGSFALCKCHMSKSGKTKTLDLLPDKKIYKPRATKPAHAYGDDGFYYYSGFAPSKRGGSTPKDSGEDTDVFDLNF